MKAALFTLAGLLLIDALFVTYWLFSDVPYEHGFAFLLIGGVVGLPLAGAFVALLIVHLIRAPKSARK